MTYSPDQPDDAIDPADADQDQDQAQHQEQELAQNQNQDVDQNLYEVYAENLEQEVPALFDAPIDAEETVEQANEAARQSEFGELTDAIESVQGDQSKSELRVQSSQNMTGEMTTDAGSGAESDRGGDVGSDSNTGVNPEFNSPSISESDFDSHSDVTFDSDSDSDTGSDSEEGIVEPPSVDRPIRQPRMRHHPTLVSWSIILAVFALVAPALFIDIYHPDVVDPLEAKALATSIHTWQRMNLPRSADESFIAEYLPHYNGQQQWADPPGVTWTQLLTFEFASPRGEKELKTTLTVGAKLTAEQLAPLPAFDATGKTMAQLSDAIKIHLEEKVRWSSVKVRTSLALEQSATQDGGADGGSERGNNHGDASGDGSGDSDDSSVENKKDQPLQAGDRVQLVVDYAPAHWRSQVDTMDLIRWGRQGSALMGLLLLGAVFWAGHSIGGNRTGTFAILVCAANPIFLFYARLASPPIHQATWAMLSIAGALWAVRPLRPAPSVERQFIGWVISGLALGFAALTTGPIVLATVAIPILLLLLLCPNRVGHLSGLVAALIIGMLMITPWTALLHDNNPDAAVNWMREHQPFGRETLDLLLNHIGQRLMLILLVVAPWTIWLIGAAIQPFSTSSIGSRTRMFLGLTWFSAISLILLTQPDTNHLGAFLPLIPVASIMIGQVFRQYTDLADEGRFARYWRFIRWPHLLLLVVVSVILPFLISSPQWFIDRDWFDKPLTRQWGWPAAAGLCFVMLAIVGFSVRYSIKQYPQKALVAWACWVLVTCAVVVIPASRNPAYKSEVRFDAQQIAKRIAESDDRPSGKDQGPYRYPVYAIHDANEKPIVLPPEVLLYAGIEIRSLPAAKLGDLVAKEQRSFFLVRRSGASKRDAMILSVGAGTSTGNGVGSDIGAGSKTGSKLPATSPASAEKANANGVPATAVTVGSAANNTSPAVDAMSKAVPVEILERLQLELLKYEIQPAAVDGQP